MRTAIFILVVLGLTGCDILPKRSATKLLKSPCACASVEARNV